MRRIATLVCFAACALALAGQAVNAAVNEALADEAREAATCAVYFGFVGRAWAQVDPVKPMENERGTAVVVGEYRELTKHLFVWAFTLAKDAGLKNEAIEATMHTATKRILALAYGNLRHLKALDDQYGRHCSDVKTELDNASEYWPDGLTHR